MTGMLRMVAVTLFVLMTACGGGSNNASTSATNNIVTGVASAGIVRGGEVKVFAPYSSLTGADKRQVGVGQTSLNDGSFSVGIGSYSGPVVVEVTGGSYLDEADGSAGPKTIPSDAPLRAAISRTGAKVKVSVTPLTELAVKRAWALDKLLDPAGIDLANNQISDLFKVDILTTSPLDAAGPIDSGTQAEKDYTVAIAAIQQLSKTSTQPLDAVLCSLSGAIGTTGSMDSGTANSLCTALNSFLIGADNRTGISSVSENLRNLGKTTLKVTVSLDAAGVKSVEATIVLPANVTVAAGADGATLDGALVPLIGGDNTSLAGNAGTPGILRLSVVNADKGFTIKPGGVVTINFNVDGGTGVPEAASFQLSTYKLFDVNGNETTGTLSLH